MIGAISSNLRIYGVGPSLEANTTESVTEDSLQGEDNTDDINQSNEISTIIVDNQTCSYNDSITNNDYGCQHNGQVGVSVWDIAEHIGNGEWGSAARDVFESPDATNNSSDNSTADNGSATEK